MELDLSKLTVDPPSANMLEQVSANVDDMTLVLGPVFQCSELQERDGTIEPDKLERLGLTAQAADEFCCVYSATKDYLQHHPEFQQGLARLNKLMTPLNYLQERPVDQRRRAPQKYYAPQERNPEVVTWDQSQSLGLTILGYLVGQEDLTSWLTTLNSDMMMRALVSALVPTLPAPPYLIDPKINYEHYLSFCHEYYQGKLELGAGLDPCAQFFTCWQHCYESVRTPLTTFKPLHGLVSGFECGVNKPRFVTLLPQSSVHHELIEYLSLYNCTGQQSIELRLHSAAQINLKARSKAPTKAQPKTQSKAQSKALLTQWKESIVPLLQDNLYERTKLLFICLSPEQVKPEWLPGIAHSGSAYLLAPKSYTNHPRVNEALDKVFKETGKRAEQTQLFTSNPYRYCGGLCQSTVHAVSIELLAKTLEYKLKKLYPQACTLIKFERTDHVCQAQPQIIAPHAATTYFVTNLDGNAPENFDKILCALAEWERYDEMQTLIEEQNARTQAPHKSGVNPYSLSKAELQVRLPDIYNKLATQTNNKAAFKDRLPSAYPEFAPLSTIGQQLTHALLRWEALLNYAPNLIRP